MQKKRIKKGLHVYGNFEKTKIKTETNQFILINE